MALTPTQIAAANQGSIVAANNANVKAGIVAPTAQNSNTFINPNPAPTTTATRTSAFPQPISTTVPAPIVATSDAANNHIQQMQTSSDQNNADIGAQTDINTANAQQTQAQQTASQPASSDNSSPDYDSQINDILGSLTDGSLNAQPNDIQQDTTDEDTAAIQQDQQNQQQVAGTINAINSGTYPLSSAEKAQVANVATSYAGALGQAQQYATALMGGATVVGAASGLQEYSPSINLGNIQNAINIGGQKIGEINSQILDAQNKLTTALMNNDYKSATDLYKQIGDDITQRTNEINTIQKAISDQTAQMRDNAKTALTTLVSQQTNANNASIAQAKADATAKQNAVDNAYKQGMLTVAQQKEMLDTVKQQQVDALSNGPAVQMTTTGADPTSQQQFLDALPGGANGAEATYIKGLADYSFSPSTSPQKQYAGVGALTQQQALTLAKQYDPSYSEGNYAIANRYLASLHSTTPNTTGGALGSAAKAINHLSALLTSMKSLNNTGVNLGIPFTGISVNSTKNAVENIFNPSTQTNLSTVNSEASGVADELAKFFKGTGSADVQSIEDWKNNINANATPAAQQGLQQGALKLLTGQLDVAYSQYQTALGKAPADPLIPMSTLTTLKGMGVDITPYLGTTVTSLTNFHDASSKNAQLMDQLVQAQPSLANDPDQMLQVLTQNGIQL